MATMLRSLPVRQNPTTVEEQTPPLEILVERRRLGQTALSVKPTQVGTSNATRAKNLGVFDYVHLRVPLPKDLEGSELFQAGRSMPIPEAYFLMRRCSDGYVSATGMFKATFPWATKAEEEQEKEHIRSLPATDSEEVAGNLWVAPTFALALALDYGVWDWIAALLDNEQVELDPKHSKKDISHPPKFKMPPKSSTNASGSSSGRKRTVSRDLRSASPVKNSAPAPAEDIPAKQKTPRKPRQKKKDKKEKEKEAKAVSPIADSADEPSEDEIDAVVEKLPPKAAAAAAVANAIAETAPEPLADGSVRVSVTSDTTPGNDNTETTRTTVKVELPANSPDMELPKDTEGVVAVARDIVESAKDLQQGETPSGPPSPKASKRAHKRKASALEETSPSGPEEIVQELAEGDVTELSNANGEVELRPTKRTRVMVAAEEYRREKMKRRALMGLSGALAVGVMIPFLSNLL